MVQYFLDNPAQPDWLWMVDADMVFSYSQLIALLEVADPNSVPIVGGLCFGGRTDRLFPTLYRVVDPATNNGEAIQIVEEYPDNALVRVDATGAAFLLIHRGVLEAMRATFPPPQYWFSESVYKGEEFGEDWTFCLRAAQLDIPVHVHTGVEIGHVKQRVIGAEDFKRLKAL